MDAAGHDDAVAAETRVPPPLPALRRRRLARVALAAFAFTFVAARVLVLLIMSRRIPDLYFYARGTHVHHLNYGIFLLSAVGAVLLFVGPTGRALTCTAFAYGIGLALTFDEFGMWLHMGGPYWQRASFDAVVIVAAVLGLLAVAPPLKDFHPRQQVVAILLCVAIGAFAWLLIERVRLEKSFGDEIQRLERSGPQ